MHSFIIVSKNKKTALDFTSSECKKNQIDKFDINILTFQKAIGIEDIRNFQKKIYLKPIKSKAKAITLEAYSGITIGAQNALLKVLEEPPNNTIIYITIQNKNLLLPTILSRCKIVELNEKSYTLSEKDNTQYLTLLTSLLQKPIGERLKLAQDITRDKGDAVLWLEKMIIVVREKLIDDKGRIPYLNILKSLQKAHTIISTTNANQRLVLESLFLNL